MLVCEDIRLPLAPPFLKGSSSSMSEVKRDWRSTFNVSLPLSDITLKVCHIGSLKFLLNEDSMDEVVSTIVLYCFLNNSNLSPSYPKYANTGVWGICPATISLLLLMSPTLEVISKSLPNRLLGMMNMYPSLSFSALMKS